MRYQCAVLAFVFLAALLLPGLALAEEQPVPPAAYYGTVTLNGQPAPVDTVIVARIDGEVRGQITVKEAGKYGGAGPLDPKLQVSGTVADTGKTVTFEVAGKRANETVTFRPGSPPLGFEEVNLTVSGAPQPPQDTTPPAVAATDPDDGATGVPVGKTVTVTFSEDVQAGSEYEGISLKDASGKAVAVTKSIAGKVLSIDPNSTLAYSTKYTVTVPASAVKDLAGNALAQDYTFSFTTQEAPGGKKEEQIPENGVLDNFTPPPNETVVLKSKTGVELEIAPGTVSGTAKITVRQVEDKSNLPAANMVGQVTEIKIENVTLAKPVTIRLPVAGVTGERIRAFKLIDNKWVNLGGELKNGVVEFAAGSFSYFTVANSPAPPTAQPVPGTYSGSVQVTLSAEPGASIYYSTDGSTPSKLYTAPLTLTSNTTLKALAERNSIQSEIATFSYTVTSSSTGGGGGAPAPSADKVEKSIQAGATTVAEISGKVKVEVPAGAVTGANAAIKAEVVGDEKASGAGMTLLSKVVDIALKNGTLTGKVTITLYFDKGKLGKDQEPAAFCYDEKQGKWVRLEGTVDADKGTVTVTVDRLTMFAVFAVAKQVQPPPLPLVVTFKDMQGHWAADAVGKLAGMGIVSGYPDGTFGPGRQVIRAEIAAILVRALKLAPGSEQDLKFRDNAKIPAWARGAVAAAVKEGLVKGYLQPDGTATFEAGRSVTRAELAVLVARILEKELGTVAPAELKFTDAARIPAWARSGIGVAVAKGIVTGYPDGTFRAERPVTRAEAATVVLRLLDALGGK